jgi:hypothetical protein
VFVNNVIFVPLEKYFCNRRFSESATIRLFSLSIAISYGIYRSETTVIAFESHSAERQRNLGLEVEVDVAS